MMNFKPLNNNSGMTLPTTLIVMLILFILGVAILSVSVAESLLTTKQHDRTQAYFSAKSGIEIAIKNISTLVATGNYDEVSSLYTAVNVPFTGSINASEDQFSVSFVDGGLVQQDKIKILSQGTKANSSDSVALTLHFSTPSNLPLDWLNPGQIMRKGFFERTTNPVVVKTAKLLGHAPKKSTTAPTTWRAPSIHFIDNDGGFSFEVTAKSVEFQTNLLSFKKKIFTKNNDDSFVIKAFNPNGFRHDNGSRMKLNDNAPEELIPDGWGVVVLKEDLVIGNNKNNYSTAFASGYYAFAPGVQFSNSVQRDDLNYVKPITSSTTIAFIDEVIRRETSLGFNILDAIWSKN